jgi:hypothetical protein
VIDYFWQIQVVRFNFNLHKPKWCGIIKSYQTQAINKHTNYMTTTTVERPKQLDQSVSEPIENKVVDISRQIKEVRSKASTPSLDSRIEAFEQINLDFEGYKKLVNSIQKSIMPENEKTILLEAATKRFGKVIDTQVIQEFASKKDLTPVEIKEFHSLILAYPDQAKYLNFISLKLLKDYEESNKLTCSLDLESAFRNKIDELSSQYSEFGQPNEKANNLEQVEYNQAQQELKILSKVPRLSGRQIQQIITIGKRFEGLLKELSPSAVQQLSEYLTQEKNSIKPKPETHFESESKRLHKINIAFQDLGETLLLGLNPDDNSEQKLTKIRLNIDIFKNSSPYQKLESKIGKPLANIELRKFASHWVKENIQAPTTKTKDKKFDLDMKALNALQTPDQNNKKFVAAIDSIPTFGKQLGQFFTNVLKTEIPFTGGWTIFGRKR